MSQPGGTPAQILNGRTAILDVVAGDYFEIQANQDSGATITVLSGTDTWFEMEVIR